MGYKIGDKVKKVSGDCCSAVTGGIYTVQEYGTGVGIGSNKADLCSCESTWELVTNNNQMNLKQKFALAFKGEPEKSFIKAGVMNADESLTEDGQELVLRYVLTKFKDDFKKDVIDPILAEQDKTNN